MTWLSDEVVSHLRDVASWPDLPDGRYRVLGPIGRGGMGSVYAARDERLGRDVAIKLSNAPAAGSVLDDRLKREALVLAELEHPGIAPVHDIGVAADGRLFYVMKLVRGETLDRHVGRLTTEAATLGVFERIVESIAFAHARGVVHRDVKPSNVMVGAFGEVLLLDWGTAKRLAEPPATPAGTAAMPERAAASPGSTEPGTLMGTPGFMAPEQAEGRVADVTTATDVFALGALLFWLLTNDTPPADAAGIEHRLQTRASHVSARLRAIAAKCLATRSADRYADAGALGADLARYRAGLSVTALSETLWDRLGRWAARYRTFILLIAAYLVMRALVAWWLSAR